MGDLGILIIGVVDTFFAFFVVAPMMLQAASLFGVQKQFAKAMVQEGVVKQEDVDRIHPKKQLAGVVISLIMLAVLAFTCAKASPWGYICGGVGLVVGLLKYRTMSSTTVKRSSASRTPIRTRWMWPSSTSSWRRISDKFKRIKTSPALCAGEVFIHFFQWCRRPVPRRRHTAPPPARQ